MLAIVTLDLLKTKLEDVMCTVAPTNVSFVYFLSQEDEFCSSLG